MDIFNKFFNEMTDGYFLEIGNFSNDPDNLIHKLYSSYRWHGVCMVKDTLNVNTQDIAYATCDVTFRHGQFKIENI